MNRDYEPQSTVCRSAGKLISDYADGTLSARETWEVEKHLAACPECATMARQLQKTVDLLRTAERFETSDDFMAKLHARLDGLDPEPARPPGPFNTLRGWLAAAVETLRVRRAPVLSLGMALAGFAALLVLAQPLWVHSGESTAPLSAQLPSFQVQQTLERQVAASASDPLGDAAAERLSTHAGLGEEASGETIN